MGCTFLVPDCSHCQQRRARCAHVWVLPTTSHFQDSPGGSQSLGMGTPCGCLWIGVGGFGVWAPPHLHTRRRLRAILIPAVCSVLLSCVFSVRWLAVAGFMDGVVLPPSLSRQRPQPLGLRHSLFSLPPGAPRPPGGTPTAPPR